MYVYMSRAWLLSVARRTKEEALKTRSQLLDTAANLFCEKGVGKTSLDDIAKSAGVTRGAFYWHFKNKDDILEALWEESGSPENIPDTEWSGSRDADPIGYLQYRAIQTLNDAALNARAKQVWTLVFHKMELDSSPLRKQVIKSRQKCRKEVLKLFESAKKKGAIDGSLDTTLLTSTYFAYLDGVIYNWLRTPKEMKLAIEAENLVSLFFRNLK